MNLYIGIDPSISCTGVFYNYDDTYKCFYSGHSLKKYPESENIEAILKNHDFYKDENIINKFLEKYNITFNKKANEFFNKSFIRFNIISQEIVNKITNIIKEYNPEKVIIYYEDYSYGSAHSSLAFDVAEFNMILKDKIIRKLKGNIVFNLVSPKEIKKYATNKGTADKYIMYRAFIEKAQEGIKNEFLEVFKPNKLIEEVIPKGTILKEAEYYKNGKLKKKAKIQKREKVKIYEEKVKGSKLSIGKTPMADLVDAYFIMEFGKSDK